MDLAECDGKLLFSKVRKIINGVKFNDILDVWLFNYNGEINLHNAITDEVDFANWLSLKEIQELYKQNKLVPTLEYIFDIKI